MVLVYGGTRSCGQVVIRPDTTLTSIKTCPIKDPFHSQWVSVMEQFKGR
jgi:hypothetical protein